MTISDLNVMIVEDNRMLRRLYETFLRLKGANVVFSAADAKEATEYYNSITGYPDIVIMDYRLPIRDGISCSEDMLHVNPRQLIVMASADRLIAILHF